jgi:pre-mRNA-splicing factor SYF1
MAVWLRYLNHKKDARISILSRAVIHLPGSYKLFKMLLDLKTENAKLLPASDPQWQETNYTFEQSLLLCHRYPLIWMAFCSFLMLQNRPTYTRRTFDRALMALPLTQHAQIWDLYLKFAKQTGGETCVRIWRRFLKIQPTFADQYVDILLELKPSRVAEAAMVLTTIIEYPEKFASGTKTQYQYWSLLCDIICQHPENIKLPASDHLVPINLHTAADRIFVLDVEKILRAGIARFSDQVGRLWNSLAQWWVIRQDLERARDVYEEALASVKTVRDFTLVFDAFAKMEQDILSMAMDHVKDGVPDQDCILDSVEIDLRLARLERLIDQRPLLLNNVLLRQNPHNVVEWTNRIQIVKETNIKEDVLRCYQNATNTIVPQKATGNPTELWIEHAKYCESITNMEMARSVFEKAVLVSFKKVNDLSNVYIEWAQMELRNNNPKGALRVIGRATSPTSGDLTINYNDESKSPQQRLFKCVKLWTFYIEVEESIGSISSVKAVYDRILELKIATPQVIMNYAAFLEKQKYYEDVKISKNRATESMSVGLSFSSIQLHSRFGTSTLSGLLIDLKGPN